MISKNIDLKPYHTFGLEVKAKQFATFNSIKELKELFKDKVLMNQEVLILGGGSNVLFTKDFKGLVLKNNLTGVYQVREDAGFVWVEAMAGEVWHDLVIYAIENNLGGIENLSLIPGSVGAAPMQNIGAYGVELKDVFVGLEALNIETGKIHKFDSEACAFGYRESVFKRDLKNKFVIVSIVLKLSKQHVLNTSYGAIENELTNIELPTIKDVSDAVIKIRESKLPDPKLIGNSGSFFKYPVISLSAFELLKLEFPEISSYPVDESHVKVAAGWLIDHAGWKGKTFENYGVHKNQALVLVNYGGADGQSILDLSNDIIMDIKEKFNIDLEREVNVY